MIIRELINLIGYEIDEAAYKEVEGRSKALFDSIGQFGREMSIKVTAPLTAAAAFAVNEFTNYKTALAFINQTIASTGGAAKETAADLLKLSESMSGKSLYAESDILEKVTGHLLMYDKISGKTFDGATQATVDLAARMKIDLASAARIVGRSLNDPIGGLMLLQRSQIGVTRAEIAYIEQVAKAGRIADAQRMVLDLLNRKVGGSAQVARDASSGFMLFTNKTRELAKQFGEILQPYFKQFYETLVKILDKIENMSPETKKWLLIIAGIAAAIGPIATALGGIGNMGLFTAKGIDAIAKAIKWVVLMAVPLAGLFFEIIVPLLIIGAIVAGFVIVIQDIITWIRGGDSLLKRCFADVIRWGDAFTNWFVGVLDIVQKWINNLPSKISGALSPILSSIGVWFTKVWDATLAWLSGVGISVVKWFDSLIITLYNVIPAWIDKVVSLITTKIQAIPLIGQWLRGVNALFGGGAPAGGAGATSGTPVNPSGTTTPFNMTAPQFGMNMFRPSPASTTSATTKNVNVNSTIAMTVPAGTQQQQITAVKQAAEQAVSFAWNNHLRATYLQVQQ